ncbi:MAG: hypothetical protein GDA52_11745 [Rhodobacteraceae bacterium]|nr:hypothetical protein [Paracoccaceae bacterium]
MTSKITGPQLHAALLAAHAAGDRVRLIALYDMAAHGAKTQQAEAFYLTQAYIFALEAGAADALRLRTRLQALGAESMG